MAAGEGQSTTCSTTVTFTFYKQEYLFPFTICCCFLSVSSAAQTTFSLHSAAKHGTRELRRYSRGKHMPDAHYDFWLILPLVTLITLTLLVPNRVSRTKRQNYSENVTRLKLNYST